MLEKNIEMEMVNGANGANYVVSQKVRNTVLDEMMAELDERGYKYRVSALEAITNTSYEAKQDLYNVLSKHPNWDEEKLMIRFDSDFSREFNKDAIFEFARFLKNITGFYDLIYTNREEARKIDRVLDFITCCINEQFFDESMKVSINNLNERFPDFKLRTNMKSSKAIGKICKEMGWDKLGGTYIDNRGVERSVFNREYAKLCDNLNPIKVTRHTCISLNPIDFLLMSNGNSWESCHYIGDEARQSGCYSSGTISYMLDETTFVFYTVDASYEGNAIERTPKMQRQIFGYKNETLFQSRLYPQSMDCGAEQVYKDIREIVQKVISECINKPNLWYTSHALVEEIVERGYNATCYGDFYGGNPGSNLCRISFNTADGNTEPKCEEILIGAEPIGIYTGSHHTDTESIDEYNDYNGYYCTECGEWVDEECVRWIGDEPYCGDCVSYCEHCGDYVLNDEITETSNGIMVCETCLRRYYTLCDHCGEYHPDEDITYVGGHAYCEDCLDEVAIECYECGEWIEKEDANYDEETGRCYCDDCYNELLEEREEEMKTKEAI